MLDAYAALTYDRGQIKEKEQISEKQEETKEVSSGSVPELSFKINGFTA